MRWRSFYSTFADQLDANTLPPLRSNDLLDKPKQVVRFFVESCGSPGFQLRSFSLLH
jgi:hypothetical protein